MAKYKVAQGGSILGYDQKIFLPGDEIPEGYFKPDHLRHHVKAGYLVRKDGLILPPDALPPGVERPQMVGDVDLTPEGRAAARVAKAAPIEVSATPESTFAFDPDALRDKDVDELNVMIQERDSDCSPFDTVEEAVAYLSQDYVAPTAKA